MDKSIHFSGQPTFSQLINLIPKQVVANCIEQTQSDRYYKKFTTWHHLVTMLFTCYGHCHSLREVVSGMRALGGRLQSSSVRYLPTRSTFSDANSNRDSRVFELIYFALKKHWDGFYPDSRKKDKVYIIDSTTIKLFQEIFKGAGLSKSDGRRKGGVKVHMAVHDQQNVPTIMHISQAAYNDVTFTKNITLPCGSTVVMDRGYRDHTLYNQWDAQRIRWITLTHPNSYYVITENRSVNEQQKQLGVSQDAYIRLGHPAKRVPKVNCRLIKYTAANGKQFDFITNDLTSDPSIIADLYKKRWGIELLFKRLKQNMPLHYFLGDNQNAIKIQIWCALIADLLLQIVRRQVKRVWAFSNIVSIIRLHLFNYLNLYAFLENPERSSVLAAPNSSDQLKLLLTG